MENTFKLKMEKFNGINFLLWKLKMEDLFVDPDIWVAISGTKPTSMKYER